MVGFVPLDRLLFSLACIISEPLDSLLFGVSASLLTRGFPDGAGCSEQAGVHLPVGLTFIVFRFSKHPLATVSFFVVVDYLMSLMTLVTWALFRAAVLLGAFAVSRLVAHI